jgi:hypothetical protein
MNNGWIVVIEPSTNDIDREGVTVYYPISTIYTNSKMKEL